MDENLFFGNAEAVERRINEEVAGRPGLRHVVLVMSSVSYIDATALEMLTLLNQRLSNQGIALHLAEVKGPVLDCLARDPLLEDLGGAVHLSTWSAFRQLRAASDNRGSEIQRQAMSSGEQQHRDD